MEYIMLCCFLWLSEFYEVVLFDLALKVRQRKGLNSLLNQKIIEYRCTGKFQCVVLSWSKMN